MPEAAGSTAVHIQVANDVIGAIAGMAALEVEGVHSMSGGIVEGIAQVLGRRQLSRGVHVEVYGRDVSLDLFVVMDYGARIPEVAERVQANVKAQVENMTGLTVDAVNIHVQGVWMPAGRGEGAAPPARSRPAEGN